MLAEDGLSEELRKKKPQIKSAQEYKQNKKYQQHTNKIT